MFISVLLQVSWFFLLLVLVCFICWLLGFLAVDFLVSKFLDFLVLKFLGCSVSKIRRFTKCSFHAFWKILIPQPRFENLLDKSSDFFRRPSFRRHANCSFPEFLRFIKKQRCSRVYLFFKYPGFSKDNVILVWGLGAQEHVRKSRNHRSECDEV